MASAPSIPSSSTFSFKAPLSLTPHASGSGIASPPPPQKQRRVSLALPSSPRLVPAWNFRDDTTVAYAPKGKVRRIDVTADEDEDDEDGGPDGDEKEKDHAEGDAATPAHPGAPEKKARRKWTPEETQMLVDGCNIVRGPCFLFPFTELTAHTIARRRQLESHPF